MTTPLTPDDEALLRRAIELADEARAAGNHPFGALLAVDGVVVAEARNLVTTGPDATAHAETELVRVLERGGLLGEMPAGVVYTSCEPCPMCVGAMKWAGARRIVFGLTSKRLYEVSNAPGAERHSFETTAAELAATARPTMTVAGPFLEDEAARSHEGFWY